jgi:hypothetical protein
MTFSTKALLALTTVVGATFIFSNIARNRRREAARERRLARERTREQSVAKTG